jgi:hypothetical protein
VTGEEEEAWNRVGRWNPPHSHPPPDDVLLVICTHVVVVVIVLIGVVIPL